VLKTRDREEGTQSGTAKKKDPSDEVSTQSVPEKKAVRKKANVSQIAAKKRDDEEGKRRKLFYLDEMILYLG